MLERWPADALSLALFAALGAWLADSLWPLAPDARSLLAVAGALAGPLGCAIERGRVRPLGWSGALLVAAGAAAAHVVAAAWLAPTLAWPAAARAAIVLVGGLLLARAGARLDRGEAGWRAAARLGPPDGTSPLALVIARWRLPRPLRALVALVGLPLRVALLAAIRLYQLTASRLMPPACRFEPTCSRYGFEAIWRHGALKGTLLTALRLVRCSPIGPGGLDPVPLAAPADGGVRGALEPDAATSASSHACAPTDPAAAAAGSPAGGVAESGSAAAEPAEPAAAEPPTEGAPPSGRSDRRGAPPG